MSVTGQFGMAATGQIQLTVVITGWADVSAAAS